jgi:hypothetical protein
MTDDQPPRGRRSNHAVYSAEVARTICDRLFDGQSLRAICSDAGMPGRATVFRWIARHKEFRDWYTLARQFQAEDLVDEMIEIADDTSGDWVEKIGADGRAVMSWIARTLRALTAGSRLWNGKPPGWRLENTDPGVKGPRLPLSCIPQG